MFEQHLFDKATWPVKYTWNDDDVILFTILIAATLTVYRVAQKSKPLTNFD